MKMNYCKLVDSVVVPFMVGIELSENDAVKRSLGESLKLERINRNHFSRGTTAWILALAVVTAMTVGVQCSAATVYVSQTSTNPSPPYATPDTAAQTIQPAVDAANDGDTVLVEPGQYDLTNQVTITKGITLRSTMGAGQTFVNAEVGNYGEIADFGLWVSNSTAVVDGLTVQSAGFNSSRGIFLVGGTVQNCVFADSLVRWTGTAVYMVGGILRNSVVTNYRRFSDGGSSSAIYCSGGGLVTDCQVLGGAGSMEFGIGVYLVNSQLRNCLFSGTPFGPTRGVALAAYGSTILNCTITHNYSQTQGGGAYLDSCLMDQCIVSNNFCADHRPGNGGGGIFETNSVIRDSLIVDNLAGNGDADGPPGFGGGVYMQGGALINCTVTGNRVFSCFDSFLTNVTAQGAGVYVESGGLTNCIVYGNFFFGCTNSESEWFNAGPGIFDHCCTTPNPDGVGNIVQNPQFVDPANGNYHLATNSPCIAAGVVQPWMTNALDLEGSPRTINGVVDMGAYQNPFATAPQLVMANFLANPNSGQAPLTVQFTGQSAGPVTRWDWNFGDGVFNLVQNPSHTYTNAGSYMTTLTVSGISGQTDSATQIITVTNAPPAKQIETLIGMLNLLIQAGALNKGDGNTLLASLKAAANSINDGKLATACNQVGAFVGHVQTLVRRSKLTQAQGQSLTNAANQLRAALDCR